MTTIENKELEESWVKQDWVYIKTALILAFFTAIEVFTYFESVHKAPEWLLVTTLSFLMVVKFFLVAGVFMHLKDDNSVFTKMMTMGMCIAWPVYFIMAFALGFLPTGTSLSRCYSCSFHLESQGSGWDSPLKAAMEGITKSL